MPLLCPKFTTAVVSVVAGLLDGFAIPTDLILLAFDE